MAPEIKLTEAERERFALYCDQKSHYCRIMACHTKEWNWMRNLVRHAEGMEAVAEYLRDIEIPSLGISEDDPPEGESRQRWAD